MKIILGDRARRRVRNTAVVVVAIAAAAAGGRALLASATSPGTSAAIARGSDAHGPAQFGAVGSSKSTSAANASVGASGSPSIGQKAAGTSTSPAALVPPVQPVGPDIVRSATVDLHVSKGTVGSQLSRIGDIAASNGGYVDSSSMSGGTARSAPVTGQVVIRVVSSDFTNVLSDLSGLGKVSSEQVSGRDVTSQVAENSATADVLQSEVNLLETKLAQATDINVFLQIEAQLAPVQQQLQQLQSQQAVLQNSVAFASLTVNLAAPGAPAAAVPTPKPQTNAARVAWHYASHNTLAVLDGLAVAGGWALPLFVLGALVWLAWKKVVRRKRPQVTPA